MKRREIKLTDGFEEYIAIAWDRGIELTVVDEAGYVHEMWSSDFGLLGTLPNRFYYLPEDFDSTMFPNSRNVAKEIRQTRIIGRRYLTCINNQIETFEYHTFLKSAVKRVMREKYEAFVIYERDTYCMGVIFSTEYDVSLHRADGSKCSNKTLRKIRNLLSRHKES